uniref:DNA-directed DNA polymerase n=1 Tax=Strongyloides venezuelensis TaxID=75913 RepID=A0A0K0FRN5_STRVS
MSKRKSLNPLNSSSSSDDDSYIQRLLSQEYKNENNDEKAKRISKKITKLIADYITENCYTAKQVLQLNKLIKNIIAACESDSTDLINNFITFFNVDNIKKQDLITIDMEVVEPPRSRPAMKNPDTCAFAVDIKNDLESYIKYAGGLKIIGEEKTIKLVIYCDDIVVSQPLGPYKKNNNFTHVAYKCINLGINSHCKEHYRTFSVVQTKYAMSDSYEKLIRMTYKIINGTIINVNGIFFNVEVVLLTGDNLFMNSIFKVPLCFTNRGTNNCRSCHIDGREWYKYQTCESVAESYKKFHGIDFIGESNHYISDGFHDINSGCLNYFLCGCINIFLKITPPDMTESKLIELIIDEANVIKKQQEIRTLLYKGMFRKEKNFGKKIKFNMSGSEILIISECFLKILINYRNKNLLNKATSLKISEMISLIKSGINLAHVCMDQNINYERAADICDNNTNLVFVAIYRVFGKSYTISTKLHNLLHYGKAIRTLKLSPYVWNCVRFECKF